MVRMSKRSFSEMAFRASFEGPTNDYGSMQPKTFKIVCDCEKCRGSGGVILYHGKAYTPSWLAAREFAQAGYLARQAAHFKAGVPEEDSDSDDEASTDSNLSASGSLPGGVDERPVVSDDRDNVL